MASESQTLTYENTKAVLKEFAQAIVDAYKEGVTKYNAIASHRLLDKVSVHTADVVNGRMIVSLNLMEYWKFVEAGREAGKLPPIDAIEQWVKWRRDLFGAGATQRGIPSYASLTPTLADSGAVTDTRSIAWAVATNIKKKGIKARPILAPSVKETVAIFKDKLSDALGKDVAGAFAKVVGSLWTDVKLVKGSEGWYDAEIRDTMVL